MSSEAAGGAVAAGKVTGLHLSRSAFLYVRQSTLRQVLTNTESGERQYALKQRAVALGWPADSVITIDVDQGQSGASASDREGFKQLVAEVSMGHAGIVLGLEVSRLARNNADWHRLLELCSLTGTLICDEDGLYNPSDFNDQLLLGLKGTMSQAELHFIRARLIGGQRSKAIRGELKIPLPVGLIYDHNNDVKLDADAAVQQAIRLLFSTFAAHGSARAVVQEFNKQNLKFPVRHRTGPRKGELAWAPLTHSRVLQVLHSPRYAGAFSYGRKQIKHQPDGHATLKLMPRDQWIALIPDAHPAYIAWQTFETNHKVLLNNAAARGNDRNAGPAREGSALLQGIVICGNCGQRMSIRYHTRKGKHYPTYNCLKHAIEHGGPICQSITGSGIDEAISQLVLDTITPLSLETALQVQAELEANADNANQLRASHVERARQNADYARRRYLAVDPHNRLVADNLESEWNNALRALQDAQDDYERAQQPKTLDPEQRARIHALANDIPRLWNNPATPARERKRIIRHIIEDVTITATNQIQLDIRYRGGSTTSLTIARNQAAWKSWVTPVATIKLLDELLNQHTDGEAAEALNQAGHKTGTSKPFNSRRIINLRRSQNLPSHKERLQAQGKLTLTEMAASLEVHTITIKKWHAAGIITGHKANDKNEYLYDPPGPKPTKQQGTKLTNRSHNKPEPISESPGGAV